MQIFLFCLGLALGSFLHVLASRYDPDRFLLTRETLGGRSYCPGCRKTLAWYELIPLLIFLFLRARCRSCGAKIGWSYFWVELICGFIVMLVPWKVAASANSYIMGLQALVPYHPEVIWLSVLWTLAFLTLLLITLVDLRLQIIPDELVISIGLLGIIIPIVSSTLDVGNAAFWVSQFGAAFGAALFFGALVAITRGQGMGMGDVKFAFALGLLFGWPKVLLLLMLAFILGAIVGVALIAFRFKNMKSAVPFGPFLSAAALAIFFYGDPLVRTFKLLAGW